MKIFRCISFLAALVLASAMLTSPSLALQVWRIPVDVQASPDATLTLEAPGWSGSFRVQSGSVDIALATPAPDQLRTLTYADGQTLRDVLIVPAYSYFSHSQGRVIGPHISQGPNGPNVWVAFSNGAIVDQGDMTTGYTVHYFIYSSHRQRLKIDPLVDVQLDLAPGWNVAYVKPAFIIGTVMRATQRPNRSLRVIAPSTDGGSWSPLIKVFRTEP